MHSLRMSMGAALVLCLMAAPLAFADDDDRDNSVKGKGNGKKDEKSFFLPFTALGTTTGALQAQIQSLQETLQNLKAQREALDDDSDDSDDDSDNSNKAARDALKTEIKETKKELKLLRSLSRGMSGDDVRDLQEFLHAEGVYPEGVFSGFYGSLTEEAVKRFQEKHGIERAGIFGPQSRAKAFGLFGGFFPPGLAKKLPIDFSSSTPSGPKVTVCHKPVGETPTTLSVGIAALAAHLIHGDNIGTCGGSTGTTTPDTLAPTLSAIVAGSISSTTAQISWTTNENSSSRVWYGTSSPLTLASPTSSVFNSTLVVAHSLSLSGLSASTTYYIVVESKDAAGNTATSSGSSFVTAN
jgi:peptidoglycan hydrolase-like protein with peptidoglycan-binding domain